MPISRLAPWLVPGALWLWLFFHLHYEWALNPQYQYGWAVPFLAIFMFYQRWQDRPPPSSTPRTAILQVFLLGLLLPIRLIEEANPDWRLLSWVFALIVVAYSLLGITRAGGKSWLRHFAFPICFPLVAVPWLVQFENVIVQGMTRAVAFAAVEIVGWFGIGALQMGNVIELHNGFVGVNEACSGVKTFQAAIMVTLVLGELSRLSLGRRVALLSSGSLWVFAGNIVRATLLVVISAQAGTAALGKWHDLIGTVVILVGMAGLLALSRLLGSKKNSTAVSTSASSAEESLVRPIAALVWLVAIFGASELWFRVHEKNLLVLPSWQVRWPQESAAVQFLTIPDETRAMLKYNQAQNAAWEEPRAVQWWGFFARWEPQRAALQLVRSHSPDICLPAVGRTFLRELPPVTFATTALPLRFRTYEFEQNNQPLFVFVCVVEDKLASGADGATSPNEWSSRGRLRAVLQGRRNLGQRLLELAVVGFDAYPSAEQAAAAMVNEIVERAAPTD